MDEAVVQLQAEHDAVGRTGTSCHCWTARVIATR